MFQVSAGQMGLRLADAVMAARIAPNPNTAITTRSTNMIRTWFNGQLAPQIWLSRGPLGIHRAGRPA